MVHYGLVQESKVCIMLKISSDLTLEEKNLRNLKTHAEGVISDNIGAICVDDNGLVWMGESGWRCVHL